MCDWEWAPRWCPPVKGARSQMSETKQKSGSRSAKSPRRRWSEAQRRRIVAESYRSGESASALARRHGVLARIAELPHPRVHELLPWNWKAARRQTLAAQASSHLTPRLRTPGSAGPATRPAVLIGGVPTCCTNAGSPTKHPIAGSTEAATEGRYDGASRLRRARCQRGVQQDLRDRFFVGLLRQWGFTRTVFGGVQRFRFAMVVCSCIMLR